MVMGDISKQEGYNFKKIKSNKDYRTFKVICCENGIEEDSAISYDDAINLILEQINFSKEVNRIDNEDKQYIQSAFNILIGRNLSEINEVVENEIAGRKVNKIVADPREKFALEQVYLTPNFRIIVSRENYRSAINKVSVEERIY